VGDKLFLTLIFDRRVQTSRIGLVWLYTKRAIRELLEIIVTSERMKADQVFDAEFSASLSDKLDSLFINREMDGMILNEEEGYATGRKLKGSQPG
jgi:hypothetical protein